MTQITADSAYTTGLDQADKKEQRLGRQNFLLVAVQAILVAAVLYFYNLESAPFRNIVIMIVAGFLVHHFLPFNWKMPFFLGLSLVGTGYVVGLGAAGFELWLSIERMAMLLGAGVLLIGICHLPIYWYARVAILVALTAALAFVRVTTGDLGPLDGVLPILASMFMFRLMIYVYDIRHETTKPHFVRSFSYFFALPNVCFPLFPVIDYSNFKNNYFKGDMYEGYQRGLDWMLRGVFHLLLWRLVYYHLYVDPSRVVEGTDVARYLFGNMGLYLRVSGQFHLVVGMLHLFGFFLPRTNYHYFLAESVNDYWRRVNIYWKDYMQKIFYMPAVMFLKQLGQKRSLVLASVYAFVWTWFLHSYQWFWLRSEFTLKWQDGVFWTVLGVAVVFNSVAELETKHKASDNRWLEAARSVGRMLFTFSFITLVWAIWNVDNWQQVGSIIGAADQSTLGWVLVVFVVLALSKLVLERPQQKASGGSKLSKLKKKKRELYNVAPKAKPVLLASIALLIFTNGALRENMGGVVAEYSPSLFNTKPPKADQEFMVRGYYEDLMDVSRSNSALNDAYNAKPRDHQRLIYSDAMRPVDDLRTRELLPNVDIEINGQHFQTNEYGFRDKTYPLSRADDTCRVAVLGTSFAMGWGVSNGENYIDLLEERLNTERAFGAYPRYELLNFSVNSMASFSQLEFLNNNRVMQFDPQVIMLSAYRADTILAGLTFERAVRQGVDLRYPYLKELAERAGIDENTTPTVAQRRVAPFKEELTLWGYQQVANRIRELGATPVMLFQDDAHVEKGDNEEMTNRLIAGAEQAGFNVIYMQGAYGDVDDVERLQVAPWDHHPNKVGHEIIAERLYNFLASEAAPDVDRCWQR